MRRATLLALVIAASCAAPAATTPAPGVQVVPRTGTRALRRAIDSVVNAPEFANGHWGVLVVDTRGDTLYSHNAGKLFMPASNQKILTSAVALALLGPDYRYRTSFVAHGPIENGVLQGDLGVIGRGDPSVSDHMLGDAMLPLLAIADSLSARGVTRIRGKVLAEGNAFPDAVLGFGWSWDDLEEAYSAPIDELLFNEGFTNVIVRAGERPGDAVRVSTRPTSGWPTVRVSAATVAAPVAPVAPADTSEPRPPRPELAIRKDTLTGDVLVSGTIAAGDSATLVVTHRDPDAAYIAALREALASRGIAIVGDAVPPVRAETLATLVSPPLREILPPFLKPSQNQIGEMLFKTLGLERDTAGTARVAREVLERQLLAWGATPAGFVVRDGSGLSRYDYVSPETIVHVLDAMRRDTAFAVFYDALPIAGVDGTLRGRMRGTPAAANVRAKTGSVAQARSLSGYARALSGDTLMFSILANNWNVPAGRVTAAADSIAARLASWRRR